MILHFKNLLFQEKFHSRWLVFITDMAIVVLSLCLSFFLKNKQNLSPDNAYYIIFYSGSAAIVFLLMGIHRRIVRYSNTRDMLRIIAAVLLSNTMFLAGCKLLFASYFRFSFHDLDDIILINFFISASLLMAMRITVKDLFTYVDTPLAADQDNILIYGADSTAILIKRAVEAQKGAITHVKGFVDSGPDKLYKCIEQKQVYPLKAIESLKRRFAIKKMFVTNEELTTDGKKEAIEKCIELGIKVVTVPPADHWLNGQPNLNQFEDLKIEDLLERAPIVLHKDHILDDLKGKRILITGAAGSIGSEIVRQVLGYEPACIILCDQAETPLHDIQMEIEDGEHANRTSIFVCDIQNAQRVRALFDLHRPQIVFHAAAYKHVPLMENNPAEAVLTNIWGTKNLADISVMHGVEKFIMISTDKAVRPTNVMGASKRIAEMYIQSLNSALTANYPFNNESPKAAFRQTKFITTRFGNVLGSNGSVIPRFKAQIQRGGPVTVTHPEITRYFMTIPESVHLVLEAAVMGNGGEIFLFDMGEPVKIADLAANMVRLAGHIPGEDIKIVFTGLRPGEKLYEELLNKEEEIIPTYNKDIKISKTIPNCYAEVNSTINELMELNMDNNTDLVVLKMKSIVPDFISNNSEFEKLDARILNAAV
ncbi:MAG: nucleoside-diphosphate sugar epimerase/dehydratase [Mucilaginibacter sp.]